MTIEIQRDDLSDGGVLSLLNEHLRQMHEYSPADSVHALDEQAMKDPGITFYSARDGHIVAGCGALKEMSSQQGELKSMKTASAYLRRGIAKRLLERLIEDARHRGYQSVWLETGTHDAFAPARELYRRAGFEECGPFGGYQPDPHSCFMTLPLR